MDYRSRRISKEPAPLQGDFNQLSLFPDLLTKADAKHSPEEKHAEKNRTPSEHFKTLADPQSKNGHGPGKRKFARSSHRRHRKPDNRPSARSHIGKENGLQHSLGSRNLRVELFSEIASPAPSAPPQTQPSQTTPRNFRILDSHQVGVGGLKQKAHDNLFAIRLLKQIENENRQATEQEKSQLVKFSGWGALASVFHPLRPKEWDKEATELKTLLTDDEYQSVRASSPNAHFTSPLVTKAMWEAIEHLGVKPSANILEPSMGVGHFFGLMPEQIQKDSTRTGIELDSITARIAQKLYPEAKIYERAFEKTDLPDNGFDVIIGNIPFGNYGVYDPAYKNSTITGSIHNYFLAKSVDKLRPGGVIALITSRFTLDSKDSKLREYLSEHADLIGAIRLPNTAFKANAGTEVTSDILFLQKREPGQEPSHESWTKLKPIDSAEETIFVNEYFDRHPEMMLGDMRLKGTMYGKNEPTLTGQLTDQQLTKAILSLPADIYRDNSHAQNTTILQNEFNPIASHSDVKDGAYTLIDDQIFIRTGSKLEPVKHNNKTTFRIKGMLEIRDAVRGVFQTQLGDESDETIIQAREHLNKVYDMFVTRYGPLSLRENIRAYAGDPDQPLLLSLENYDAASKTASKTAIFSKRTLERYVPVDHVDTAAEALTVSLNETGGITWPRMEQITGQSTEELKAELGDLIYHNPENDLWETADHYLSGNVRGKLTYAESAATHSPSLQRNVDALKAVQPPDLKPGDIEARLGSSWIPPSDIKDFIADLLDTPSFNITVGYSEMIATWTLELNYSAKTNVSNTTTYGTSRFKASDLIEQALNAKTPTAYDALDDKTRVVNQQETIAAREKQQQLKGIFKEWVWKDSERSARLVNLYNERFNNIRLRSFDGSHLWLPGMNRDLLRDRDLASHQKNAVWRIMQSGSTLLAHVVGAGKTWTMAASAMEMKRLGLIKKPMFVVPNHLVDQWGAEFLKIYPQARIFVAGKEHFKAGNRQRAMARIASENYDAVIISHRSFEFLPVSDDLFQKFIKEQVDELENAILQLSEGEGHKNRRLVKELEKTKKRFTTRLEHRAARAAKDNTITFEELGVDQLFIDEADTYKNLFYTTKMNRIAGLPNSDSNRAFDMFMKTRYIRNLNQGRGVVFATGTPISNTMAEMYTMIRYLAPDMLKERGVSHFDAWAANFAEAVTALELAPDGSGYRMHTRFARFINLPELLTMFRSFADVQTADMLNLPRPSIMDGKPQIDVAEASPPLQEFIKTLCDRAERLRRGGVNPADDNMLKITGDGRKAALDMRLIEPSEYPDDENKINLAIDRIYNVWNDTSANKSTQLVFCDLSTPDPKRFNVYHELKLNLIDAGIPEKDIAFIHDAKTDNQKKVLFDAVNNGRVRILIGSTEKMGTGTNAQRRLIALHHLDAPWRPRDIEQREGRILRQGNLNDEVQIYRYVTEGSFDAYMWQTLETKARFIHQVMNGQTSVRHAEDLDGTALTYAEIKAIASGNPAVIEKVKVDTEIRKIDQLRAAHLNQQHSIKMQIRSLPEQIKNIETKIENLESDMNTRDDHANNDFSMTVGNDKYAGKGARKKAGFALTKSALANSTQSELHLCARYQGFDILSRKRPNILSLSDESKAPDLFIRGKGQYKANLNAHNPAGTLQSIEHVIRSLEKTLENEEHRLTRSQKMLSDYQSQLDKPFEHEDRLKELLERQEELNSALDLDKSDTQIESQLPDDRANHTNGHSAPETKRTHHHSYDDDEEIIDIEAETMDNSERINQPAPGFEPGF